MAKFFFVHLHPGAPMPPASEYFKRYADAGDPQYTVATDVAPSIVPGMLRVDPVKMDGDEVPCAVHIPIGHIVGITEINSDRAPMGFNVGAKD